MSILPWTAGVRQALTSDLHTGRWSQPTEAFFRALYERVGGASAPTNTDLDVMIEGEVSVAPPEPPPALDLLALLATPGTGAQLPPFALPDLFGPAWVLPAPAVPDVIEPQMPSVLAHLCAERDTQQALALATLTQDWQALLGTLRATLADLEAATAFVAPPPLSPQALAALYVTLATAQTLTGLKTFLRGAAVPFAVDPASLVVPDLDADQWDGQDYSEGTFTVTGTGFTVNPTGTALYVKLGNLVALFLPQLTGTSNATTFTVTGLPAAVVPTRTCAIPTFVEDNGVTGAGYVLEAAASGTLLIYPDALSSPFTAAGTKTLFACWLHYALL